MSDTPPTPPTAGDGIDYVAACRELTQRLAQVLEAINREPAALLQRKDAARLLGIGATTFTQLSDRGLIGPKAVFTEGQKLKLWSRAELLAWVSANCPTRATWMQVRSQAMRKGAA
jgi:hypothetical protein